MDLFFLYFIENQRALLINNMMLYMNLYVGKFVCILFSIKYIMLTMKIVEVLIGYTQNTHT